MKSLPGPRRAALITGASSGIGADLARELARKGYDLVLTARRADRLLQLKREVEAESNITAHVIVEDLSTPEGAQSLIRQVTELELPITFLANNAGFGIHGGLLDHDPEKLQSMLQLNMVSLTTLTWHFGRVMRARGEGRILNVASVGAFQPSPYYAAYSATKAYVLFLSEAVQHELRGTGVTVTTLCPGMTHTEFHEAAAHPKTGLIAWTGMGPVTVARRAVRAAIRGRAVVTPGVLNQLTGFFVKLMPRSFATAMAGVMMR
jgi:short-subunit dehydrogenase